MKSLDWLDPKEIMWAAGLFEGEGCIYLRPNTWGRRAQVRLTLDTTDTDTLWRFYVAIGQIGRIDKRGRKAPHHKFQWRWNCYKFEESQAVIAMLWAGLNSRRRAKAKDTLLMGLTLPVSKLRHPVVRAGMDIATVFNLVERSAPPPTPSLC